ncbi:alpha-protein kinase 3 isoform X3 [Hyperolius riggenbachi]|uniref:alpha-protein kinase 3 isoform X3 n=1 Tax=Hyperolius riggenbachi TaxID=752182 RepID=UPI0035A26A17
MGTRRPMTRVPSGNGRYYDSHGSSNGNTSDSEDSNGYTPRADSRSYLLNVRPENRTTFCNIISQLTEETQPSFETTLKTKAVSEGNDAKLICMVTGFPEPEVTWYKDDEEMDRYCGLPKYEIFRSGKKHTLQLYKCSEEDAAIYQASARNNKGIVSCSGVLEVGTMNEYKIHQRWFAKLKRKAEAKMREIEQSRRRVKENLEEGEILRALSPERIQRKRRFSSEKKEDALASPLDKEELIKVHIPDANSRVQEEIPKTAEQPQNVVNGFIAMDVGQKKEVTTNGYAVPENIEENGKEFLAYVYETVEAITKKPASKESYAKKKKKEDEPPLPMADSRKVETTQGSPKKVEGISPAPRRSRFGKDPAKTSVEDKMEVETSPTITNKRFAPSAVPNKAGKAVAGKDAMKLKDSPVSISKTNESSIPQQPSNVQTKGDLHFSLRDMYFDNSSQNVQVKKTTPAAIRDQTARGDGHAIGVTPSKLSPDGQITDTPKVAPRRSKEQQLRQTLPEVKPKSGLQKLAGLESGKHSSVPPSHTDENKVKNLKTTEQVPAVQMADMASDKTTSDHAGTSLEETSRQAKDTQALEDKTISSVDSNEGKIKEETLQKLQNLEVEYMALQKAYALLQQQLELSQKAEAEKEEAMKAEAERAAAMKAEAERAESMRAEAQRAEALKAEAQRAEAMKAEAKLAETMKAEAQRAEIQMPTPSECTGTPILKLKEVSEAKVREREGNISPIRMETEEFTAEEAALKSSPETQNKPHNTSQLSTQLSLLSPMEFTSEEQSQNDARHGITGSETAAIGKGKQSLKGDEALFKIAESPIEHVAGILSNEVEMTEDEKEKLRETQSTLITEDLSYSPVQENAPKLSENVQDVDHPADISSKLSSPDQDQSVVTLLRDVKNALETGVTPKKESSVDLVSRQVLLTAPHTEEKCNTDLMTHTEDRCDNNRNSKQSGMKSETNLYFDKENVQDNLSKHQDKQDHGLVTTLKNSLLMLFHIKPAESEDHKSEAKEKRNLVVSHPKSPGDMYSPERSPRSSRKLYESGKESDSPQSPESMRSASTSGKLTPSSEEDMIHSADSLPTSPVTSRRITDFSKKGEITQVESAPLSPVAPKRSSKGTHEGVLLTKEDLSFSPATSRKIAAKIASGVDFTVPSIVVGSLPSEISLEGMLHESQRDSNRKWRSSENLSPIPSATPEELASGARRKIYLAKPKQMDDVNDDTVTQSPRKESPNVSPGLSRRSNTLLVSQSPPVERRSPGTTRRLAMLEVPKISEESVDQEKTSDSSSQETKDPDVSNKEQPQCAETKKINDPYKAPQVIRKIRAEQFSDASGNLKIWCQFFNILSASDITWYKDEVQVAKVKRCSGDEGQVALAIVQASVKDCGVYQCTIENEYGTDSTDCLLSAEILSGFISKEEVEVGEEIEMTPMVFAKGLADSGYWGDKFFGRIVMEEAHAGNGFLRKSCRVKVIYGLDPMFESGKTCMIKIRNLITFGTKNESTLVEKNYEITIQDCKIQNTTREYCKIFAAECRGVPNFGQILEILPLNLIYRPANNIPYATIEEDLEGRFEKYCIRDTAGKLQMKNSSEIEQKCCTFQHWVFQWTNSNFLVTTLEGVGWKLTNIAIATKSKGYQGLKESCYPEILEEFPSVHQCNSYCEMLGLKSLKTMESLQPPPKSKGSRSPQMARKSGSGSTQSSPQIQKKTLAVPQNAKKGGVSPKSARKVMDTADLQSGAKNKGNDTNLQ